MALIQSQSLLFRAIEEERPGTIWQALFAEFWPSYRRWYLQGGNAARPYYLPCVRALRKHMPELLPTYEKLAELVGGGDLEARFLSLFCPPPYVTACSQVALTGTRPLLLRNYDYPPQLCEGVILKTAWNGRQVIGVSDCVWGLLDGINDDGLAVSLSFGGRLDVGEGFGVPLLLRYVLETCRRTAEASAALARVPVHMSYNVTVLDCHGDFATVYLAPGKKGDIQRIAAATNHQQKVEWQQHARATSTVERLRLLRLMLDDSAITSEALIAAFLQAPIYSNAFARGLGTLYSAAYWPSEGRADFLWPGLAWSQSFTDFTVGSRLIEFGSSPTTE
ncbi:C45 family peptidase [Candidatus Accumulibacter sp. ACC003]|uniref:C45 family autoproteolytic acyltransferase/hydolase n=1 Tax=Candidatus Accumulibacter sp. ACC003 TaxID=2823334 RepID=UPI0025C6F13C|nr:C45 family peptidase [Candidatus Accumulibacter sp. ACC003]